LLVSGSISSIVESHVLSGMPYAFRNNPDALTILKTHLTAGLGVRAEDITVVGSGRLGFSLNPNNFPRQFSDESDIDVIIVDTELFDKVWTTLLRWNYPRRLSLGKPDQGWASSRRKDIYWGWFHPDKIGYEGLSFPEALSHMRDLSTRWFDTFQSISQYTDHQEIARREINGRLYRTWEHARYYHEEGLRIIKSTVEMLSAS